ncbi:MAG: UvrD-helicase domain-containing protein [Treponema sp.]|jgi:ATP-dependent helicase/nuclease subunit A|nr:UvrD-helicase domain-containing protein [Treponema sp.]
MIDESLPGLPFIAQLNDEQRAAVFCESNAVVAAGAGSGKTLVLASRFAYLVVEKAYQVQEILTLTFTKKAAVEMYQRIYATLSQIASQGSGIAQERAQRAKNDFFHAHIQTLDSYCASLVKQAALRYGIPPDFMVDQKRCRALVLEEALPFLIAHRTHPALEALYYQARPTALARDFFADTLLRYSYLDEPPDFMEEVKGQIRILCQEWEKSTHGISTTLASMGSLLAADTPQDPFRAALTRLLAVYTREDGPRFPGAQDIRGYFEALLALPEIERIAAAHVHPVRAQVAACLRFLYDFHTLNLKQGKRKDPAKESVKAIRKLFKDFSSLAVFCMQGGFLVSYMPLLQEFQTRVLAKKRREGVLTFTDVARLARRMLQDQPDIRAGEQAAFKAIMIDEFQDNNELQKDMLFLLAERPDRQERSIPQAQDLCPGKLFFVGDEKQSIYQFRGADVSVFRRLQQELQGASLSLRKNYRSVSSLIGAFNALFGGSAFDPQGEKPTSCFASVFAPVFALKTRDSRSGEVPRELPDYEASYLPVCAGKTAEADTADPPSSVEPRLTIAILDKKSASDDDETGTDNREEFLDPHENEACFVAERIHALLHRYQPADIALLFRTHTHQNVYEKQLRMRNIPYTSSGMGNLFTDGPVNDLMAALRLVAYPQDTEAYGVLLRSPLVGLSLRGLIECMAYLKRAAPDGEGRAEPFQDTLAPLLPEADQPKFLQGQGLYRRIREKAARMTSADLVSELWYTEGYRYETEWHPRTAVYRELYDYLFNLAVQADAQGLSLAGFTDRMRTWQDGEEQLEEEDLAIPLERSGAVRLMTIHKSKGLEFPVVFICGCGNRGRAAINTGAVYWSREGGIAVNPPLPLECAGMDTDKVKRNFFYEHSLAEVSRKRTAELRRLLYVAMTRAEQELYLTGSLSLGDTEAEAPFPQRVRKAILEKREKIEKGASSNHDSEAGTERIPGDAIIDDDTLFGLLLPAVAARIPDAAPESELEEEGPRFFRFEEIPRYTTREGMRVGPAPGYSSDAKGLARFLAQMEPLYARARVLHTPVILPTHQAATAYPSPVCGTGSYLVDPAFAGEAGGDLFQRVDAILHRAAVQAEPGGLEEERFTPADFGTLAHACTEAVLRGAQPRMPERLGWHLSATEAETLLAAGTALAERFVASPLGKLASGAALRKSEYRFRTLTSGGIFIEGTIDLLFETEDAVAVVDFKTDRQENPEEHLSQMIAYYQAACTLRKKPCLVWLYYLRSGHAVLLQV